MARRRASKQAPTFWLIAGAALAWLWLNREQPSAAVDIWEGIGTSSEPAPVYASQDISQLYL